MKKLNKKHKTIIIIAIAFVILCISAFYNGLIVRKYTIHSDKILKDKDIKIVVIADLHSHIYGKNQNKIINKIVKQSPDIVLLVGDIVDDQEAFHGAKIFLERVKDIVPCYYVSGNHEYWSGHIGKIKKYINQLGIHVLDNKNEYLEINNNEILLYGIDDPAIENYCKSFEIESWEKLLESIWDNNSDKFKILLSLRPEKVDEYKKYRYDLIVSGHSHGGLVRIPFFLNGLFAPDQGFFPKYAGGLYEYNNTKHIVSRGVSFNLKLPRIFNPPEIVSINIVGHK
jgi:predicted MPP superfamily phosphohydrolase